MVVVAGEAALFRPPVRAADAEVDRLYRRHREELLRYAVRVTRSEADAEDVTQATFVRAYKALARGERVLRPRSWLMRIAHNECLRLLALRSRRAEVELGEVVAEGREPGGAEYLRAAIRRLAPAQRRALVLREVAGCSYAEIAQQLDLSASAVEALLFRARRALREQLEGAVDCGEARSLIELDALDEEARGRLRAHVRGCPECATLERRARGRRGALRRLASSFGLPWGVKVAAVAVGVSTVAVVVPRATPAPPRDVPPVQVDRWQATAPAAVPHPLRRARVVARPHRGSAAIHRTRPQHPAVARTAPATRHAARPARHVPARTPAAAPAAAAPTPSVAAPEAAAPPAPPAPAVSPAPAPAPAPTPTAPASAAPVAVTTPEVATPAVTVPPVETPLVTTPAVELPAVTVPSVTVVLPQLPPLPHLP